MMVYWDLFIAFFIPNAIGYGGGPAIIPLIETEVVGRYEWVSSQEFAEILALGNSLPGPIATKMAAFIGYDVAGIVGSVIAVLATVVPSLILMLGSLGLLYRHRNSPQVKRMSQWVRPIVAVLMTWLTWSFFSESLQSAGVFHTIVIAVIAGVALLRFKIHPAGVVLFGLVYGGLFIT